LQLKGNKSTT